MEASGGPEETESILPRILQMSPHAGSGRLNEHGEDKGEEEMGHSLNSLYLICRQ